MSFPVRLVLFALAYGAGAELSYLLLSKTDNAIAFWPPAGIYLAMLLATPRRRWWAVMLAAGIPNLLSDAVIHQHSLMVSVVFLLVNLGAPLVGVAFITRLCRAAFTFERLSHVLIWSIATSLVSAPLSALFGGLTTATVYGGSLRQKMLFWWLGDLLGLLLVTPLVYGLLGWRKWPSQRQGFETAALLLSLSAATTLIFRLPEIFVLPPSVLFFFLLWAALRFGATAVAAAATVLAVISIWLTEAGLGPFSYLLTAPARLLMAQILVVTGALLFYVIAAVMAERRASESEFFNRITDIAPTTLYIYDLNETRNVWINRDVFEVLSYTSTEVRELGAELLATLMHPEDKVQYAAHYEHLRGLPAGEAAEFEYRMRHQDGSWRWFISREMAYARDADGAVSQIVGAATDITANKQAEEALRRSEERFRSLIEATAQITWTNSAAGEMRGGQEQWGAFTGQSFEQYQNYGWADALHPDDRAHTLERWQQSVADRILFEAEHRVRRRDGEYCHCLVRAVPVLNANGEIREWVGIHTDISEEKRLLAAERKARELAEAANRLKDEFLATVSHELRTPLNHMLGWVVMLRTDSLTPEKAAEALATIERNVRAQNRLVEDLLDVSRIVTGKMQLLVQSVVMAQVIEAAVASARPAAEARGIRLQVVLDSQVSTVSGDADRLQQIVWNLISNAIKFTPKGGRVQVRLERIKSYVTIIVSDTGEGLAPEFLPYAFDRFSQADPSIKRKQGGLGLGLAIVRHLVELHGGEVSVTSEGLGQGTTFTVTLPLRIAAYGRRTEEATAEATAANAQQALSARRLAQSALLKGVRVLVVDDETDSRMLVAALLTASQAEVRTAGSLADALTILDDPLNDWRPDALISDIGMPGGDGYELIRAVRQRELATGNGNDQRRRLPAVALTAYARSEDRLRAIAAGFQMHVAKPVEPEELITVVASLTGRL